MHVLYDERVVEIYHEHLRIVTHARDRTAGGYTTRTEHMPSHHRFYASWSPERILGWAREIGPAVETLLGRVLDEREHPEQGFKVALGIISLHKKYGEGRLERACRRALEFRYHSYKGVKNILASGMDKIEQQQLFADQTLPLHSNIRGRNYYATAKDQR